MRSFAAVCSRVSTVCLTLALFGCLAGGRTVVRAAEPDGQLRLNELQVIGSHNSYHVREKPINLGRAREWNYTHAPLDVQLDRGVRSFELDVYWLNGEFRVYHVPLLDEGSNCRTLSDAVATVSKWSKDHPRHLPISFLFELKREGAGLDKRIKPIDRAALDEIDSLLRANCGEHQILTPDDVRGDCETLREAITTRGWPNVDDCRGKLFFILHDNGQQRADYTADHPSLRGRVMFVRSHESRDDCATLVMDGPTDPDIPRLAKAGYFIRTRADASLQTGSPEQPARRDLAFASGAHILSTDYPPGERAESGYIVEFGDGAVARVNPVSGPEHLRGKLFFE
jgi:hypothetical protein